MHYRFAACLFLILLPLAVSVPSDLKYGELVSETRTVRGLADREGARVRRSMRHGHGGGLMDMGFDDSHQFAWEQEDRVAGPIDLSNDAEGHPSAVGEPEIIDIVEPRLFVSAAAPLLNIPPEVLKEIEEEMSAAPLTSTEHNGQNHASVKTTLSSHGSHGSHHAMLKDAPPPTQTETPTTTPAPTEPSTTTPTPTKSTTTPAPTKSSTTPPAPTKPLATTTAPTKAPTTTPAQTKAPTTTPAPTKAPTTTPAPTKIPTTHTPTEPPTTKPAPTTSVKTSPAPTKPAKRVRPPMPSSKSRVITGKRPVPCRENPSSVTDCSSCMKDVKQYMTCLRNVSETICKGKSRLCLAKKNVAKRRLKKMPTKDRNMSSLKQYIRSRYPGSYDSWKRRKLMKARIPSRFRTKSRNKTKSPSKKVLVSRNPSRKKSPTDIPETTQIPKKRRKKLTAKQKNINKVLAMLAKQSG